jgi:hypothetical protein
MAGGVFLLTMNYVVFRAYKGCAPSLEAIAAYDEASLKPRYTWVFSTWREYENSQ